MSDSLEKRLDELECRLLPHEFMGLIKPLLLEAMEALNKISKDRGICVEQYAFTTLDSLNAKIGGEDDAND